MKVNCWEECPACLGLCDENVRLRVALKSKTDEVAECRVLQGFNGTILLHLNQMTDQMKHMRVVEGGWWGVNHSIMR